MLKILTVVGARPQFIKAAVVSRAFRCVGGFDEITVHTGQHYDANMSRVFFDELEIPQPAINLGVGSGTHGAQTGRMLEAIECIILQEHPDWVLVYGDTNSTLAGALAATKLNVSVAHVEAGLRSFNRRMPEEVNRTLTDHVSDVLFVPTESAALNLNQEGLSGDRIHHVGDVMYDAALFYSGKSERESSILQDLGLGTRDYVLATIHRAENTGDPLRLRAIFDALALLSRELPVIVPLHPRTRLALEQHGILEDARRHLRLCGPVGYLDMTMLEKHARMIATDSGGVQKEAFFHSVPCVTLRDETEWIELLETGWNRLAPPGDSSGILETARVMLNGSAPSAAAYELYGSGNAGEKIARIIAV